MKIVVATDSFKGTLSSLDAGRAMAEGIWRVHPAAEVVVLPVADGGEGTVEAVLHAVGGRRERLRVDGPLGDPVDASYGVLADGRRAVIEMAAASGLPLVQPDRLDPMRASTYGTGQLMAAALNRGCRELLVAVGGSASVDGGCGAAQALGVRFLAADGRPIEPAIGGGGLKEIHGIATTHRDPSVADSSITVLRDVTNPLCGPDGAARIFGPQKGAGPEQVEELEAGLTHLAEVVRRDLGIDLSDMPGAGAAGGLGGGLVAFLGARLTSGVETVLKLVNFDGHLPAADLVVTGEGRLDAQSMMGKVVSGVASHARAAGVPVIAIAGAAGPESARCLETVEAYYVVADSPTEVVPLPEEAARSLTDRTAQVFADRAKRRE